MPHREVPVPASRPPATNIVCITVRLFIPSRVAGKTFRSNTGSAAIPGSPGGRTVGNTTPQRRDGLGAALGRNQSSLGNGCHAEAQRTRRRSRFSAVSALLRESQLCISCADSDCLQYREQAPYSQVRCSQKSSGKKNTAETGRPQRISGRERNKTMKTTPSKCEPARYTRAGAAASHA